MGDTEETIFKFIVSIGGIKGAVSQEQNDQFFYVTLTIFWDIFSAF